MFKFAVLTIALVLVPGLQSTVVSREQPVGIVALPAILNEGDIAVIPDTRPLPLPESEEEQGGAVPDTRPLPIPESEEEQGGAVPDTRPQPSPGDEEETIGLPAPHDRPVIEAANPCSACFEYITELVEVLANIEIPAAEVAVHPDLPQIFFPEDDIPQIETRPLPRPVEIVNYPALFPFGDE